MGIKTEDTFVSVLGKKLRVRWLRQKTKQEKSTIVFLHEGLGCIELWKNFPRLIAEATGLDVVIYERQGYGQSEHLDLPRPKNYLEIEAHQYLPALLQTLKVQKPILIGHSDGATIALLYAAKYPVRFVITEAAHVLVEPITIRGIQTVVDQYYSNNMEEKLKKYHAEKANDLFWAWADTWLAQDFKNWNVTHLLPSISCPVLLIQGKEDEYATPYQLDLITKSIGDNAQSLLLGACQHIPHLQQKQQVLAAMTRFIQQHI